MENNYTVTNENVYFHCRKQAALYNEKLYSRESTSELLGVSPSTLANYELGITKAIPVDMVVMMSDLYGAPQLKALYCKNECPIGTGLTLATEVNSIESVVLKILKSMNFNDLNEIKESLINIASDGIITDSERPELEKILNKLDLMAHVISELKLTSEKYLNG